MRIDLIHPANCPLCNGTLYVFRETGRDSEKVTMMLQGCPNAKLVFRFVPVAAERKWDGISLVGE